MKTKLMSALVVVVAVGSASSADAEGWFEIKAAHSNKCLEVRDHGRANHDLIDQSTCTRSDSQLWRWDEQRLKNKGSGKCLDVTDRSDKDLVQLQQYSCANVPNQTFGYSSEDRIVAKHSGKCLDVAGATAKDGEKIIQYHCKASNYRNQQFHLVTVEPFAGVDKFWTRRSAIGEPSISIYGSNHTSWSAVQKTQSTIEAMISRLTGRYDRSRLNGYKVYVTNAEDWSVLESVAPIGGFFHGQTAYGVPAADFYRGGTSPNELWVSEQMICKNGVATRDKAVAEGRSTENDRHDRVVDQIVHEFSHTLQFRFDLEKNEEYLGMFTTNPEVFPGNVQNFFGVPAGQIRSDRQEFIQAMFSESASFSCNGYAPQVSK